MLLKWLRGERGVQIVGCKTKSNVKAGDLVSGGHAPTPTTSNGMFSGLELPTSTGAPQPGPTLEAEFFGAIVAPAQRVTSAPQQTSAAVGDPFGSFDAPGGPESQGGGLLFGGLSMGAGLAQTRPPDLMGGGQAPASVGAAASGFANIAGMAPAGWPPSHPRGLSPAYILLQGLLAMISSMIVILQVWCNPDCPVSMTSNLFQPFIIPPPCPAIITIEFRLGKESERLSTRFDGV